MSKKPKESWDLTDITHPLYDPKRDPTHPFYEADQKEKPGPSHGNAYKVGPGFPPKEYKWKKGCPSPYPNGRPRKIPSLKPDVKKIFEDALNEKVPVTQADKKVKLSKLALGLRQLATQFAKGDRHARRDVFTYAAILGVDLQGKEVVAEALGLSHQAILDAFLQRGQQLPSPPLKPEIRVKAPPDLIDDDVIKSAPNATPAPQPSTPAKKPLAPPMGTPAYLNWLREQNLAKQKKNQEGS